MFAKFRITRIATRNQTLGWRRPRAQFGFLQTTAGMLLRKFFRGCGAAWVDEVGLPEISDR